MKIKEKEYWKITDTLKLIQIAKENKEQDETITKNRINHLSTNVNLMRESQEFGKEKTLAEAEKELINRTHKGICLICKKKDDYSKERVCGKCSLKWIEMKGMLKDYIKKEEVGKVIDDFCFSGDKYDNIDIKEELKKELGL